MGFKNKQNFQRVSWWCNLFLALLCAVSFAFDVYFGIALVSPHRTSHHFANRTPLQVMHHYWTQITPGVWLYYVWAALYGTLIIWFTYVFYLLLCRQSCSQNKNSLFSAFFWFLFIIVNVLNPVWLYLFARRRILISGIVLLVKLIVLDILSLTAVRTCSMAMQNTQNPNDGNSNDCNSNEMYSNNNNPNGCNSNYGNSNYGNSNCGNSNGGNSNGGNSNCGNSNGGNSNNLNLTDCYPSNGFMPCEVGLLNFLTLNGIPFYVMLATITACFQWAVIFQYFIFNWSDDMSTVVALSIFTFVLLIYWTMDLLFLRQYTIWTWFPSIALTIILSGVITQHNSIGGRRSPGLLFAFILAVVSFLFLLLKACTLSLCYPKSSNPRFSRI